MKEHKYIRRTKKHYGGLWFYKLIELIIGGINNGK